MSIAAKLEFTESSASQSYLVKRLGFRVIKNTIDFGFGKQGRLGRVGGINEENVAQVVVLCTIFLLFSSLFLERLAQWVAKGGFAEKAILFIFFLQWFLSRYLAIFQAMLFRIFGRIE